MQIRKNDTVHILSGKDRGKSGKVLRVFPAESLILIEGLNLRKKHVRPREQGKKGQIVQIPARLPWSTVMLVCPSCGKPSRFASGTENGKKVRVCKKCKATS